MLARHSKGRWGKFPVVWNKQYVLSGEGRDCAALGTERGLSGCRERGQHGGGGGEGASSLSPGGLWGSWSDSPVSQVNAFTLHPESDRKPLKGFEQGLTQSYLRFRKVTSGSAEGTAGCGGAARGGAGREVGPQTWGVTLRHRLGGARMTLGFWLWKWVDAGAIRWARVPWKWSVWQRRRVTGGLEQAEFAGLWRCPR